MKIKRQFLRAVRILAPNDEFIYRAAQSIPERDLPVAPGGAALEFVVAVQQLRRPVNEIQASPCARQRAWERGMGAVRRQALPLDQLLRIRSAQYWMKLGNPDEALREVEHLPKRSRNHPAATRVRIAATKALNAMNTICVQE